MLSSIDHISLPDYLYFLYIVQNIKYVENKNSF